MRIVDITRPLSPDTAPWPGDTPFTLQWKERLDRGGFVNLSALALSPHIGTHVDAPCHVRDGEPGIGELALGPFVGPARVVRARPGEDGALPPETLAGIDPADPPRLLFRTDTNPDPLLWNPRFAAFAPETADILANRGVRLVGIDTPGIDLPSSSDLPVHHRFVEAGIRWIENLDLSAVEEGVYDLIALPLRISGGDASPVRAVLIER
ncbi:MAG: cyclase family protein [Candidatus Eisenbacteria bacterium]